MPAIAQGSVEVGGSSEAWGVTSSNLDAREMLTPDARGVADARERKLPLQGVMPPLCGENTSLADGELHLEPTVELPKILAYSSPPPPPSPPPSSSAAGLLPACRVDALSFSVSIEGWAARRPLSMRFHIHEPGRE